MPFRIHPADIYRTGDATQKILDSEDNTFQTDSPHKTDSYVLLKSETARKKDRSIDDIQMLPVRSIPDVETVPWTYFISSGNLIKIGKSVNVRNRFKDIRCSSAQIVILLAVTKIPEKLLHQKFSHLRVRGEWFRGTDELMIFIAQLDNQQLTL